MSTGTDISLQPRLCTSSLVGPGVWPAESESELAQTKSRLERLRDDHQYTADHAKYLSEQVFSQAWTSGDGADAAYGHYAGEHQPT